MTNAKPEKVALVVGAGDFLGGAIARRFAREGFQVVATRRRGDLAPLTAAIEAAGGQARAIHSDARDEAQVEALVEEVERDLGSIEVTVFNVGGNVRFPVVETTARVCRAVGARSFSPARPRACAVPPASPPSPAASRPCAPWPRAWRASWGRRASTSPTW